MKVVLMIAAVLLPFVSAGLLGGEKPIKMDLNDEKVSFAASKINDYFSTLNSNEPLHEPVKVLEATKQLVAGNLYKLKIKMSNNQICDIKVLEQVWATPVLSSLSVKCEAESEQQGLRGQLLGAEEKADFNDDMVKEALRLVTDRVNQGTNSMYRVIPTGGSVTKQIVNGVIFRFKDMLMKVTTCRNNEYSVGKFLAEDCAINGNSNSFYGIVSAKVYWDRSSYNVQDLTQEFV